MVARKASGRITLGIVALCVAYIGGATYVLCAEKEDRAESSKMNSREVNDWRKAQIKRGFSESDVKLAVEAAKQNRDLLGLFMAVVAQGREKEEKDSKKKPGFDENYAARNVKESFSLLERDTSQIKAFWSQVAALKETERGNAFKAVRDVYQLFQKYPALRDMVFYYYRVGQVKGVPVSIAEIVAVTKFCKGDEKLIASYFEDRLDKKLPQPQCADNLKKAIQALAPATETTESKTGKKTEGKDVKKTEGDDAEGGVQKDDKEKVEKKPSDRPAKKEKPVDDVLVTD